ncbi:hypothetical protein FOPG_09734 [Fusarium oxysporum f. sp. conglutinans race 2 54008]|uniref:Uncharacterized protein n=1 Tax=Fusarium oxysporum f. sp. conglutinans race 2 54008 TaxID=1089457 RepID=X0HTM9_FUSOX|nr:hypothetical protein FOPG_09734 [Fusarium oxysporum f. sp. conglutinans race 2 54008]
MPRLNSHRATEKASHGRVFQSRAVLFQPIHEETTTIFSRQGPVATKDQECLKLFAVVQSDDLVKPLLHLGEI